MFDGFGEHAFAIKNISVFGKEAKNQPRHEVIHIVAACRAAPLRIVFQQFDIKAIQAAGGTNVEGTFTDLFNRGDACKRQEETKMIWEIFIFANQTIATAQVFRLEILPVGGKYEFRFVASGSWTVFEFLQSF